MSCDVCVLYRSKEQAGEGGHADGVAAACARGQVRRAAISAGPLTQIAATSMAVRGRPWMDRNGPSKSRWLGYFVGWEVVAIRSGGGVDGSRRLGGREDGGGERGLGRSPEMMSLVVALSRSS